MKILVALALLIAVASALSLEAQFENWQTKYNKRYYGAEYAYRLKVFEANLKVIAQRNAKGAAHHDVNEFTALTPAEFRRQYLQPAQPSAKLAKACLKTGVYHNPVRGVVIPDSFDWRDTKNVVQDVQDQKSCGSCWAFSTSEAIEGVVGVAGKAVGVLSPQYVVDCSKGCTSLIYNGENTTVCNAGCGGGWPWTAMQDVIDQGGIPTDKDYPYKGVDQTCKGNKFKTLVQLKNYTCLSVPDGADEDDMASQLILLGPLSIALDADPFQSYSGGILDNSDCQTEWLNHAVLLVGFGVEGDTKYWIIKNSWGKSWGEKGYVRLVRGVGACGVNNAVSSPILK